MGTPSDHTARGSIWYTTVWGERLTTSALSTTLVSSWGARPGPTRKTWAQMALPSIRPAAVAPATVWSFSVVGTWSSAMVTVPPVVGTNRGGAFVVTVVRADAPLAPGPHADADTHSATTVTSVPGRSRGTPPRCRGWSVAGAGARPLPPASPAV